MQTKPELVVPRSGRVAIVRHNLFEPSETFIRAQAGALTRYAPFFVARRHLHDRPSGVSAWSTLEEGSRFDDALYSITGRSKAMQGLLREQKADVVHAHFGPDGLYASHSARMLGLPLVITLHGRDVTVTRRDLLRSKRPVATRYALGRSSLGRDADLIICVSDEIKRAAVTAGIAERKLTTHYIGVDTGLYSEHVGPREPYVVHVARLVEKKGTADLIDAFAKVAAAHPDHRLIIVGEGPLAASLKERAAATPVAARIEFRGRQTAESVRALVGRAQLFVLPSVTATNGDREGLPIALIEAMSLGTPILSTRHSGIPEAISSPEVGTLVAERDVEGLARSLHELLGDPAGSSEMGRAGARRAREQFDLARQTQALERIYDSVR